MPWTMLNGETLDRRVVDTGTEAAAGLDEFHQAAQRAMIVYVYPEGQPRRSPIMAIGAGGSGEASFFASDGAYVPGAGDEPTDWFYGNQDTEIPAGVLLPYTTARAHLAERVDQANTRTSSAA